MYRPLYLESDQFEFDMESYFEQDEFGFEIDQEWEEEVNRGSVDYARWIQQSLNKVLGLRLAVDGVIGAQTRSAIRSFQQRRGLTADGIVGSQTEAALIAAGAGAPPGSSASASACPASIPVDCPVPGTVPDKVLNNFGFNNHSLNPLLHPPIIKDIATQVASSQSSSQPIRTILISGHTDPVGDDNFNFGLGRKRAEEVMNALCVAIDNQKPGLSSKLRFELTTCGERQQKPTPELSRRVEVFLPKKTVPTPVPPRPVPPAPVPPPVPPDLNTLIKLVRDLLNKLPGLGLLGIKLPTSARFLTSDEQTEAKTVFGSSLDFTKILISDGLGGGGRPFTVAVPLTGGFHIVMNMGDLGPWHRRPRSNTLIHELTHAWQSQHHGSDKTAFMKNSVSCQLNALMDLPIAKVEAGKAAAAAAAARGVFNPITIAEIAADAAAKEDVSAYAYIPGKSFSRYAAEQIAQQVEHGYRGIGSPTPVVLTTIKSVGAHVRSADNEASLATISFHRSSTPGVIFT